MATAAMYVFWRTDACYCCYLQRRGHRRLCQGRGRQRRLSNRRAMFFRQLQALVVFVALAVSHYFRLQLNDPTKFEHSTNRIGHVPD